MTPERDFVTPLGELNDYRMAEGDPDVRGWEVLAPGGERIGTVDELFVDTASKKVRYLDIDAGGNLTDATGDGHFLIPIGYARLDHDDDRVFVDALTPASIRTMPAYRRESVTREYETRLRSHLDQEYSAESPATGDFYDHDFYDQDRFYAGRRGEHGKPRVLPESERNEFGEVGRDIDGDGISPEDDLDHVHGP